MVEDGDEGDVGKGAEMVMNERNGFLAGARTSPSAIDTAETCHKIPALLPLRTRCGKPTCRCRTGALHGPYWVLRWREGGSNRRRYVPAAEVAGVRAVVERRRRERAVERLAFAADLALLRQLEALRRRLDAELADLRGRR